jgi:hypothetical protein
MEQRTLLYDERFLESYAGAIITDSATAIVELVANCWDAYLKKYTRVDGFVLGDKIEPGENEPTKHGEEVKISPLLYDAILIRAEKRLLSLHSKVKDALFLVEQQDALKKFLEPVEVVPPDLVEAAW